MSAAMETGTGLSCRHAVLTAFIFFVTAVTGASSPAAASGPIGQPQQLEPPRLEWTGEELSAFAAASIRIEAEIRRWLPHYEWAGASRAQDALLAVNDLSIRVIIRESGLTLAQYGEIERAVQGEPRLYDRMARLARRSK